MTGDPGSCNPRWQPFPIIRMTGPFGNSLNKELTLFLLCNPVLTIGELCMRHLFNILRKISLVIFSTGLFIGACAQTGRIQGVIKDSGGRTVQFANVLLVKSSDSSLVKGMIADSAGKYFFDQIGVGKYYITASVSGMEQGRTKEFEISAEKKELDLGALSLARTDRQLNQVTVMAKKPMFEQKIDRTVINVRNSITNAGGTALEVLEKSPGVTISRENSSISLNGKNGVGIMINGKITYMPADAVVQLLSGISAGNIEKIELITTPPSKYDAGGNGGYINIVLINNPFEGFNGSYFLTAGYGDRPLGAAGCNFNYRNSKFNFYGDYSFNYEHTLQPTTALSQYLRSGDLISNRSYSDRDAVRTIQNARIGMDYQLNRSSILGVLVSGYISRWTMLAKNEAIVNVNNLPDTTIKSVDDPEINLWQNLSGNLNFQHTFKPGKVLYIDANYIYYKDNNPNTYSTDYYNHSKDFLYHQDVTGKKITPIHISVFSSDYTASLGKKITLESGVKLSLSDFVNDVSVNYLTGGVYVPDMGLSAKYLLKENIGAAYTSVTLNFNSSSFITAGLRYEYTFSNLGTEKTPRMVNRKYGEFFPTFFISKKFNGSNQVNFSYSRRITRPAFNDLAPFTIYFDPKTYYSGNPALVPAIANAIQISYSIRSYNFTLGYTHEINTIDNFYFQTRTIDTISNIVYLSSRNFKYKQYLTASFSLPFIVNSWWSMQNNLVGNWSQINTAYDNLPVRLENFDYTINTTQRINLPNDFAFEVTAMYSSASYVGTAKRDPHYQLGGGLQKKFHNGKDVVRFAANDVFNSGSNYRFIEHLPFSQATVSRNFNFRLVSYKLTYTHSFGNNALKGKRERATGAEEELNRVKN